MRILAAPLSVALSAALRAARLAVPRLARATWLGLGLGFGFGFGFGFGLGLGFGLANPAAPPCSVQRANSQRTSHQP